MPAALTFVPSGLDGRLGSAAQVVIWEGTS
jgi:hypothetical protein